MDGLVISRNNSILKAIIEKKATVNDAEGNARILDGEHFEKNIQYQKKSHADKTVYQYSRRWEDWRTFSEDNNYSTIPADPQSVSAWIIKSFEERNLKISSVRILVASINYFHGLAEVQSPTTHPAVKNAIAGIHEVLREKGKAEPVKSAPIMRDDLNDCIFSMEPSNRTTRDAALLLLLWGCALRRSELSQIKVSDVILFKGEPILRIQKQKNHKVTKYKAILKNVNPLLCAFSRINELIKTFDLQKDDYLFGINIHRADSFNVNGSPLCGSSINRIVKRYFSKTHIDELSGQMRKYTSHSGRRGFVSQARKDGLSFEVIMEQTQHKSINSVTGYDGSKEEISDSSFFGYTTKSTFKNGDKHYSRDTEKSTE